ncbi:MAG: gliding motility-associated C-terminal domain-containing protein [Bacteroidales bacterium]|nr:gliding motility-associated C-terminal domain-containing protein [Bacteroidales bacterium]
MKSYIIIYLLLFPIILNAQCIDQVNFNYWIMEGNPNSTWIVLNDSTVLENGDAQPPTFFVGNEDFLNVKIRGKMKVIDRYDNDFLGFVFGYKSPAWNTSNNDYEFILFDWKKSKGWSFGHFAKEGFSLVKVNKTMNEQDIWNYFGGHKNENNVFEILSTKYGNNKGWHYDTTYYFELTYTSTRIIIIINDETIFDIPGCFEPGRFGFYSFSQQNTVFESFDYQLQFDFKTEPSIVCIDEPVKFLAIDTDCSVIPTNIISWNWDFGDGTTSNDINTEHAYEASGSYPVQLMVIDNNNCRDSVLRIITVKPPPDVNLGPDTLIPYKGSITLDAGFLGAYYYWSTGEDTRTITLNNLRKDTLVGVEVNYEGCDGYDDILISVTDPQPSRLYVPNAFSPNGDSKNDIFKPVSQNVDKFKMYVYNRWGTLIYETNDPTNGWDGKFNGSECQLGVYIWKIVYDNMDIEENITNKTLFGHVTLVR